MQSILRRAGVSTSSDRQKTDWPQARRINVVPEFTKHSIMTASSKEAVGNVSKATSEPHSFRWDAQNSSRNEAGNRRPSPPQMPNEVTFCNVKSV